MTRARWILVAIVALVVTLGIGYIWGASGRFTAANALAETRQQLDLAEARGHLLDARVALYNVNFGQATSELEAAKAPLERARERYQKTGDTAAAGRLETALGQIAEAQQLAGKLDQAANTKTAQALESIKAAARQ
jgi:hypothetical protein